MSRKLTKEERELWMRFTHDVARTEHSAVIVEPLTSRPNKPLSVEESRKTSSAVSLAPEIPASWLAEFQSLSTTPVRRSEPSPLDVGDDAGVDGNQARRYRKGALGIDATIDLHGYNRQEAQEVFTSFLTQSQQAGLRVVRVITGHGKMTGSEGVLRSSLPQWINLPENRHRVLSYDQARPEHGGQGAYMLLLRKWNIG